MRYKNVAGRFFGLVRKHACDRQTDRQTDGRTDRRTDRITIPKTTLAIAESRGKNVKNVKNVTKIKKTFVNVQ